MYKIKFPYLLLILIALWSCGKKPVYIRNSGFTQGTTYHFIYESPKGIDFQKDLENELKRFDNSLNNYQSSSIISRMNHGDTNVLSDELFETCFNRAMEISEITDGAFDITVGPLVNAWGFGFDEEKEMDKNTIDSLLLLIGYKKVKMASKKLVKENSNSIIDVNGIAQGYSVDIIATFLEIKQVENYMVEIGGELRAKGVNDKGTAWRIGIDKPIEGSTETTRELQEIVSLNNLSLSTSGNYRKFYEKDGIKYSHTIDPKTGYPARHSLLSVSVAATDCMTADAFATAFMVMGLEESIKLSEKLNYLEVYFIYTDTNNQYKVYASDGFKQIISQ